MMKEKTKMSPVKLSFFKTVFGCYDIFFSKFWYFACLAGAYAFVMTLVFFVAGQDVLCFDVEYNSTHFCTKNVWNYGLVHLWGLGMNFLFMQKWSELVTKGKDFNWKRAFLPDKGTLKMIGVFSAYICTIVLAGFCLYLLYIRVPNPNWKIELSYFTFVSMGFIFPIFGMRFFSYFAYAAQREPLPSVKTLWKKTSGNMLAIISGCTFLLMLALFLMQAVVQQTQAAKPIVWHALFVEYMAQLFVFVVLSCFMNYCDIQKNLLEKEPEDEKK